MMGWLKTGSGCLAEDERHAGRLRTRRDARRRPGVEALEGRSLLAAVAPFAMGPASRPPEARGGAEISAAAADTLLATFRRTFGYFVGDWAGTRTIVGLGTVHETLRFRWNADHSAVRVVRTVRVAPQTNDVAVYRVDFSRGAIVMDKAFSDGSFFSGVATFVNQGVVVFTGVETSPAGQPAASQKILIQQPPNRFAYINQVEVGGVLQTLDAGMRRRIAAH